MQSEETLNTNIVDNFLSFTMAICMHYFDKQNMHYFDKQNKSYSHRKVADQRRFQQKARNRFSFGGRVKICS
jgi:predicted DNA-binding protein with PD1-like motif